MPQWLERTRVNQQKLCLKAKTEAVSSAGIHQLALGRHNIIRKMQVTLSPGVCGDSGSFRRKLTAVLKEVLWSLRPTRKAAVSSRRRANALSAWAGADVFQPGRIRALVACEDVVGKSGSHLTSEALPALADAARPDSYRQ
jgi:hypothetical protein